VRRQEGKHRFGADGCDYLSGLELFRKGGRKAMTGNAQNSRPDTQLQKEKEKEGREKRYPPRESCPPTDNAFGRRHGENAG